MTVYRPDGSAVRGVPASQVSRSHAERAPRPSSDLDVSLSDAVHVEHPGEAAIIGGIPLVTIGLAGGASILGLLRSIGPCYEDPGDCDAMRFALGVAMGAALVPLAIGGGLTLRGLRSRARSEAALAGLSRVRLVDAREIADPGPPARSRRTSRLLLMASVPLVLGGALVVVSGSRHRDDGASAWRLEDRREEYRKARALHATGALTLAIGGSGVVSGLVLRGRLAAPAVSLLPVPLPRGAGLAFAAGF